MEVTAVPSPVQAEEIPVVAGGDTGGEDLHRACAEGALDNVRSVLSRSLAGLEALDPTTGCTPIVLAIQNNHVEVVRELLSAGAIVPPPGLTQDPLLLSILYPMYMQPQYVPEYYPPPQFFDQQRAGMFMPFPSQRKDGSHPNGNGNGQGASPNNLPPAEVAKTIPCRNFPNCKYGNGCVFFHPQQRGNGNANGFYHAPPMNGFDGYAPHFQPFYPQPNNDYANANFQEQAPPALPQTAEANEQDTQQEPIPIPQVHVPSALTPAFIPSFQSPPPASQFGVSPLSP
ncbi:hypothetical protein P7C73_g6673, partial [Tremellales sp. Uapishka_1]